MRSGPCGLLTTFVPPFRWPRAFCRPVVALNPFSLSPWPLTAPLTPFLLSPWHLAAPLARAVALCLSVQLTPPQTHTPQTSASGNSLLRLAQPLPVLPPVRRPGFQGRPARSLHTAPS